MTPLDHIIEATRNAGAYASDVFELPDTVVDSEPISLASIWIALIGFAAVMTLAAIL